MERIPRSSTAVVFSEFIHQSDEPMNQSVDIPPCLICVAIIVVVIMACVTSIRSHLWFYSHSIQIWLNSRLFTGF